MLKRGRGVHFVLGVEDVDELFAKSLPSIIGCHHHAMKAGWQVYQRAGSRQLSICLVEWNANQAEVR